jgi:hypothetical protein
MRTPVFCLGLLGFLCLSLLAPAAHASCWSAVAYHAAASALATGLGDIGSSAVCLYSSVNKTALNSQCPAPCMALLAATWGDCYMLDCRYQPKAWDSDALVYNMTVAQMFILIATPRYAASAYCRAWLGEREHEWKC